MHRNHTRAPHAAQRLTLPQMRSTGMLQRRVSSARCGAGAIDTLSSVRICRAGSEIDSG
jgi:hypothetical protein